MMSRARRCGKMAPVTLGLPRPARLPACSSRQRKFHPYPIYRAKTWFSCCMRRLHGRY